MDFIYDEDEFLDVTDSDGEKYISANSKDSKKLILDAIQKAVLVVAVEKLSISVKKQSNFDLFINDKIE